MIGQHLITMNTIVPFEFNCIGEIRFYLYFLSFQTVKSK